MRVTSGTKSRPTKIDEVVDWVIVPRLTNDIRWWTSIWCANKYIINKRVSFLVNKKLF